MIAARGAWVTAGSAVGDGLLRHADADDLHADDLPVDLPVGGDGQVLAVDLEDQGAISGLGAGDAHGVGLDVREADRAVVIEIGIDHAVVDRRDRDRDGIDGGHAVRTRDGAGDGLLHPPVAGNDSDAGQSDGLCHRHLRGRQRGRGRRHGRRGGRRPGGRGHRLDRVRRTLVCDLDLVGAGCEQGKCRRKGGERKERAHEVLLSARLLVAESATCEYSIILLTNCNSHKKLSL